MNLPVGSTPPVASLSGVGGSATVIGSALAVGSGDGDGVGGRGRRRLRGRLGGRLARGLCRRRRLRAGLGRRRHHRLGRGRGDRGDEHEGGEQEAGDPTVHEHSGSGLGHGASIDAMIGLVGL